MGNRVIKESIKRSSEIDKLTWFEFACWINLIVTVDDYGRYLANPIILKNDLFPMKEDVTKASIINALTKMKDVGLIQTYEHDGKEYLQIVKWAEHQTIRNQKSKFPAPSESDLNCTQLNSNENKCVSNPIQSESVSESESVSSLSASAACGAWIRFGMKMTTTAEKMIVSFCQKYGEKTVVEAIEKTAKADPGKPLSYLETVLKNSGKPKPNTNPACRFSQRDYTDETDEIIRRMMEWNEDDTADMDRMMEGAE